MIAKRLSKNRLKKAIFGCLFAILGIFAGVKALTTSTPAYAEPVEETETVEEVTDEEHIDIAEELVNETKREGQSCQNTLGAIGWFVFPTTGKISEAVDWLYEKIEAILVIKPVEMKDGTPIYEIWKYMLGISNIVFIIFLLIVVFSQITGLGISNYGIKKVLPKLIVTAILVNLSFVICLLAVDFSNIIGNGLRGVFTSIEEATVGTMTMTGGVKMSSMYGALADGTALAIGAGAIAIETGAIWMLIPTVLGAIVAVVIGLITIALRQALVALLIMIAPLAIVAYMLPNTEQWFKKWKALLMRMLVFYPLFSLLFGASSLAGWAIIASAKDGFGLMLGVAVQIFPLFFAWSLMKMSGTLLGTINSRLTGLMAGPIAGTRSWADSHRQLTKQKTLASGRTPSAHLLQYLSDRKVIREARISKYATISKTRGLARESFSHYKKDGNISKVGEREYEMQARAMRYQEIIEMDKDNYNRGLSDFDGDYKKRIAGMRRNFNRSAGVYSSRIAGKDQTARLKYLDNANVTASDELKMELARGAKIEYDNVKGYQERIQKAVQAHADLEALQTANVNHQFHEGILADGNNIARFNKMKAVMEGSVLDANYIAADAAHAFNAQSQIVRGKFKDYFDYTAPTQDVVNMLSELTKSKDSNKYIDQIIAGLRTLNLRGDTDLMEQQLASVLEDKKVELGTYTSQSLANFLMFDVKNNDPFLRRFGKYINLETARMYNEADPEKRRKRKYVTLDEYVNGKFTEEGEDIYYRDENGDIRRDKPKRGAAVLMKGTSFRDMERTAIAEMEQTIRDSSFDIDENGNKTFNYEKFKNNEAAIWGAIMPNIISDQYSFLSGSEQIIALGKGVTGVDVSKHNFDWEGIFGKDIARQLTPEQKKDYIKFMNERTKDFLGGQVPAQIAKTKSDMLESVRTQYTLKDAVENDPGFFERINEPGYKMTNEEYKSVEDAHIDEVRKEFVKSFKEDALKGFVKMHHKGYQGEAKDGLIKLLNPDELYEKYFPNEGRGRRSVEDEDEDDGMPVGGDGDVSGGTTGPVYSETRNEIEAVFEAYRGANGRDVQGFWEGIRDTIATSPEIAGKEQFISDVESGLPQYTSVSALYADIINTLFGGF